MATKSPIEIAKDLAKRFGTSVLKTASNAANIIPAVAGYRAIQTMKTPQWQQKAQSVPDTFNLPTSKAPSLLKTAFPILNVPSAVNFVGNIPASTVRSYGKTAERLSSSTGRKSIAIGTKELLTTKPSLSKEYLLKTIQNPAVQTYFDANDFLPGGLLVGSLVEQGGKKLAREGAEKLAKEGVEKIAKEGTEKILKEGTEKVLKGGVEEIGEKVAKEAVDLTPEQQIIDAISQAKPLREAQEKLYSAQRGSRFGMAETAQQAIKGEAGFYAAKSKLGGELTKVDYEPIREVLNQKNIDSLFNKIQSNADLSYGQKLNAQQGLAKLLGEKGTTVPTRSELSLLENIFGSSFTKAVLDKRTTFQKVMETTGDLVAAPRSIIAGFLDMSYGLRQGLLAGYRYPKQWWSSFKEQFKWFASEDAFEDLQKSIRTHPNFDLAQKSGLALTDLGPSTLGREEAYMSTIAEKIPLANIPIKASGRAYTGFANKFRFDIFNDLIDVGKKTGAIDQPGFLKSAAEFVNTATGRGNLGALEPAANALSTALFSPRLLASRIQTLNPLYYARMNPTVRKEALKTLFSFVAGSATIIGAAKMAGADVVTDMTNSDFGKIKLGNTRIDILGGFQQPIVLLARIISGRSTSSTTGRAFNYGEGYKAMNRWDAVTRFFESKTQPVASFLISMMKGQNSIGEDFKLDKELLKMVTPMFIKDLVELYKDGGMEKLPLAIPGFFGTGMQTYGGTEDMKTMGTFSKAASIFNQMKKLKTNEERASLWQKYIDEKIIDKDVAKEFKGIMKEESLGVTPIESNIKNLSVKNGDRAKRIVKEFNKVSTPEEKAALWQKYTKAGIITVDVAKQLKYLLSQPKKQSLLKVDEVSAAEAKPGELGTGRNIPQPINYNATRNDDGSITIKYENGGESGPLNEAQYKAIKDQLVAYNKKITSGSVVGSSQEWKKQYTRSKVPEQYVSTIENAANKYGIHPALMAAIIFQESGFRTDAKNANDRGMAQINKLAHPDVTDEQANDPNFAIDYMARLLAAYIKQTGSTKLGVAAYNVGPGRVGVGGGRDKDGLGPYGRKYLNGIIANLDPLLAKELGLVN